VGAGSDLSRPGQIPDYRTGVKCGEGGRGDERHMGEKGTDKEQEKECLKVKMSERS
jgi:hypothetical protein